MEDTLYPADNSAYAKGRVLALDIGEKRTGIAISDESQTFSFPLTYIDSTDREAWGKEILALVKEHEIGEMVAGIPWNQDGTLGISGEKVLAWIQYLRGILPVDVLFQEWDERYTTAQAQKVMRMGHSKKHRKNREKKTKVDQVAAAIILQSYLDSKAYPVESETFLETQW